MSLASVTAKLRGVALHLGRADTGGYYCRTPRTETHLAHLATGAGNVQEMPESLRGSQVSKNELVERIKDTLEVSGADYETKIAALEISLTGLRLLRQVERSTQSTEA